MNGIDVIRMNRIVLCRLTLLEAAWYRISGHPMDQSPDSFPESIHPDDHEKSAVAFEVTLQQPLAHEFRWKRPYENGLTRWSLSLSSLEPGLGTGKGSVVYSIIDISAQKALEEILRKEVSDALTLKAQQEFFIGTDPRLHISSEYTNIPRHDESRVKKPAWRYHALRRDAPVEYIISPRQYE